MLKQEIKRAIINPRFFCTAALILIFMLASSYPNSWGALGNTSDLSPSGIEELKQEYYNMYTAWHSAFNYGKDFFPLFITIPFVFSYVQERENHFSYLIQTRAGKHRYARNKFLAVGIAGSLVMIIPELIFDGIMNGITSKAVLSDAVTFHYYFGRQQLQIPLYSQLPLSILVHGLLGFSLACFGLGIATFFKKQISVYFSVYALFIIYEIMIQNIGRKHWLSLTYIYFIGHGNFNLLYTNVTLLCFLIVGISCFWLNEMRQYRGIGQ